MDLIEEKTGKCCVIGIKGRLDTTTYGHLEKRLSELFDSGEVRVLADCSQMDYISSSGLRVFLIGLKKARLLEGRFAICSLTENIREVFEISGFSAIFEVFSTKEEALKSF
jgi:anti-sigma B factor antagonist